MATRMRWNASRSGQSVRRRHSRMPSMRTADAVIESLLRHGIDTLYALPGVHNDHLFDAAHRVQDRFRVLHPRHEQTAAYMAMGAALVTGKPQAFAVVPGPGLLNASAALLTAYGMGAPVIALIGQIPSFAIDQGHGHLHEIHDQLGLLRHITKHAARIRAPHEAPALVADAGTSGDERAAATGRTGMRHRHLGYDRAGVISRDCGADGAAGRYGGGDQSRQDSRCGRATIDRRWWWRARRGRRGAGDRGGIAGAGVIVPPRTRHYPNDASAGDVVHRRPCVVEERRCGAGNRHAALLAAIQLGRRREFADRPARHRSGGGQSLSASGVRLGWRCRNVAACFACGITGTQPRATA